MDWRTTITNTGVGLCLTALLSGAGVGMYGLYRSIDSDCAPTFGTPSPCEREFQKYNTISAGLSTSVVPLSTLIVVGAYWPRKRNPN